MTYPTPASAIGITTSSLIGSEATATKITMEPKPAAGRLATQEANILPKTLKSTAFAPPANPTPTTAPTRVCVVETGTAKNVRNGLYTNEYYTSFVGYFPADKPKYSCIVVIDKPKGYQIYGGDVAAPVFRRIADKIYSNEIELQDVQPIEDLNMVGVFPLIKSGNQRDLIQLSNKLGISNHSEAPEADWVKTQIVNNSVFWIENNVKSHGVPNVLGMTLKDAYFVLENVGLKVEIEGFGRVKTQSIAPKSKLSSNQKIILKLG